MVSRPLCTIVVREDGSATMTRPGEASVALSTTQALDIAEMVNPHLHEMQRAQWLRAYTRGRASWCATSPEERVP